MGSLFIGNLCIARAEDKMKKMCKQETFQREKFMGSLFIGNLCIARAEDKMKKMCKQETFQQGRNLWVNCLLAISV